MKDYHFTIQTGKGIVRVTITASGYQAAESAVLGMYPNGHIVTWS